MSFKRVVFVLSLALLLAPTAALADGIGFNATHGTLSWSGTTVGVSTFTGSSTNVTEVFRISPPGAGYDVSGQGLGSISFTSGKLASGTPTGSATFSPGGSISIVSAIPYGFLNGTVPSGTTLFSGSFGTITWSNFGNGTGTLGGGISGTLDPTLVAVLFPGCIGCTAVANGSFTLTWQDSGTTLLFNIGSIDVITPVVPVPEPGTLAMFGTGLVSLAGVLRRKLML